MSLKKEELPTWSPKSKIERKGLHRITEREELGRIRVAKEGGGERNGNL